MAVFETWLKSDLKKPVVVKALAGNLFSADNGGNKIGVEVTDNGAPASLSGGVTGYVIRADGATLILSGTLSGNKASIVLPASAYAIVGPISIVIKLGTTTLGACTSYVYKTTTDAIVDPGHVIPSIEELLAKIAEMEAGTAAANAAASNANTKATLADQKATLADQKATLANTAAGSANTAASAANTAASKIDNMTVSASGLPAGSTPTATISEVSGHKHIAFGLVKGDKGNTGDPGKDFHIAKTFASISAMNAYTGTDIEAYDFAMIDTGSVQDEDTGKLYCYEPDKTPKWQYIGDLSGAQGIKGETGTGIDHIALNQDYTLTIYLDDGTSYTTGSIRGAQGVPGVSPTVAISTISGGHRVTVTDAQGDHSFDVMDGVDSYVHISYSAIQPTADSDMKTTPDEWIGVYTGTSAAAPTAYTAYAWYKFKGETGTAENMYGSTIPMSPQDSTKVADAIAGKVNANQGAGNAGKALGIDNTGAVVPVPFSGDDFTGATASTAGVHGYVPAPAAGDQGKALFGDGTWKQVADPADFVGATASSAGSHGLVPAPAVSQREMFLCGDGTWEMPEGGKLVSFDLDTVTNTSGSYTHTTVLADVTHDMKAVMIEVSNPDAFNDQIHILTADGSVTLTCDDVAGTSDVTISCLFVANPSPLTSSEFDVLANRIGTLASLQTTNKSNVVAAINENVSLISSLTNKIGNVGNTDLQTQVSALNSNLNAYTAVSFTPESGIEVGNLFIRRYGRVVCVNGAIIADTAFTANQLLGYIQEGCRPVAAVRVLAGVAAEAYLVGDIAFVAIGNDGGIRITAKSGNTYKSCYFSASYVVQS